MFLWELPHFLAITLYRGNDHQTAGYKVTATEHGTSTAKVQIVLYLAALCPVTLVLVLLGVGGPLYLWTELGRGSGVFPWSVCTGPGGGGGDGWARMLFPVSLLYLTVLMAASGRIGQAVHRPDEAAAVLEQPAEQLSGGERGGCDGPGFP